MIEVCVSNSHFHTKAQNRASLRVLQFRKESVSALVEGRHWIHADPCCYSRHKTQLRLLLWWWKWRWSQSAERIYKWEAISKRKEVFKKLTLGLCVSKVLLVRYITRGCITYEETFCIFCIFCYFSNYFTLQKAIVNVLNSLKQGL